MKNNTWMWIIAIIIIVIIIGGILFFGNIGNTESTGRNNSRIKNYNVDIRDFSYNPQTITIKVGDTVEWENHDSVAHTITSDSGNEMDSQLLSKGQIYSHTFNKAGSYNYHCTPHPIMKGTINVNS